MAPSTKPLILMASTPAAGHFLPTKAIAKELLQQGFEVTIVCSSAYKAAAEEIGCSFVSLKGNADFSEANLSELPFSKRWSMEGVDRFIYDLRHIFIYPITAQYEALQEALQKMSNDNPGRSIITISESFFMGTSSLFLKAPGIKPKANISLGIVPMCITSKDTAPFGPGIPPSGNCEQNIAANQAAQEDIMGETQKIYAELLTNLGITAKIPYFFDTPYLLADRFLQMCIPSVEYPRSDAPSTIRFTGGLPKRHRDPYTNAPGWWDTDILGNTTKKIVAVSQGTVQLDYADLIIPTLQALASHPDIIVVAALGSKGATLPEGTVIPENARVADYIPFDELLPHCAVFVTNGGYGAVQHAIANATPLVIAGETEDKPETAARAEWAGLAINLKTKNPSEEVVAKAVKNIINDTKFKKRALELQAEMKSYDPMKILLETIEELDAGGK